MRTHKTLFKTVLVMTALFLTAGVLLAGGFYPTPEAACAHDSKLQQTIRSYERAGYVLTQEYMVPVNYFVEPTGDYVWGYDHIVMERPGANGAIDCAEIEAEVTSTSRGFTVTGLATTEFTL